MCTGIYRIQKCKTRLHQSWKNECSENKEETRAISKHICLYLVVKTHFRWRNSCINFPRLEGKTFLCLVPSSTNFDYLLKYFHLWYFLFCAHAQTHIQICNLFYFCLNFWLNKILGFGQLNDTVLFHKTVMKLSVRIPTDNFKSFLTNSISTWKENFLQNAERHFVPFIWVNLKKSTLPFQSWLSLFTMTHRNKLPPHSLCLLIITAP